MKKFVGLLLTSMLLTSTLLTSCSKKRSQASAPDGEQRDYRALMEQARSRKEAKSQLKTLQKGIASFQTQVGRLPTNLYELVRFNILDGIPPEPEGYSYGYNYVLGNVSLQKKEE